MAFGVLNWTPDTFWKATPYEFNAAVEGWNERNGGKAPPEPMTSERLRELMETYPDG